MTLSEIREAIEERFISEWDASAAVATFENVQFTPPDEKPWVRVAVQPLTEEAASVSECPLVSGVVSVQIRTPLNTGTKTQDEIAALVLSVLSGSYNGVVFEDSSLSAAGEVEGWYLFNIYVGFEAAGVTP